MHLSSNISHWVCLLAGLYLVLTGFMLRNIADERPPRAIQPAGALQPAAAIHARYHRAACFGRRAVMIAVGLIAVAYGISRLLE